VLQRVARFLDSASGNGIKAKKKPALKSTGCVTLYRIR